MAGPRTERTYDDLVAENEALLAENASMKALVFRMQSHINQKDEEILILRTAPPRVLDKSAKDMFGRPYMGQSGGRR